MASVGFVTLTIVQIPGSPGMAAVNVKYQLAGDPLDVALQTPYREICQLIGDDTPGGTDDVLLTIHDSLVFFPNPEDSNPVLSRNFDRVVPFSVLNEDNGPFAFGEDEIRARVTLTGGVNTRESNLVLLGGPVINPNAESRTEPAKSA